MLHPFGTDHQLQACWTVYRTDYTQGLKHLECTWSY